MIMNRRPLEYTKLMSSTLSRLSNGESQIAILCHFIEKRKREKCLFRWIILKCRSGRVGNDHLMKRSSHISFSPVILEFLNSLDNCLFSECGSGAAAFVQFQASRTIFKLNASQVGSPNLVLPKDSLKGNSTFSIWSHGKFPLEILTDSFDFFKIRDQSKECKTIVFIITSLHWRHFETFKRKGKLKMEIYLTNCRIVLDN